MYCQLCEALRVPPVVVRRRTRRRRTTTCERCGAIISLSSPGVPATGTRLTRFGLAITGEPLLEPKHEGI
jgi:hypothetical protein